MVIHFKAGRFVVRIDEAVQTRDGFRSAATGEVAGSVDELSARVGAIWSSGQAPIRTRERRSKNIAWQVLYGWPGHELVVGDLRLDCRERVSSPEDSYLSRTKNLEAAAELRVRKMLRLVAPA